MTWLRACPMVLIVAVLFFLLTAVRNDAQLKIAVEGARIQFEPGTVRLRIRVEPDKANRALTVGLIGPDFETSTLRQLEGDQAALTHWFTFKAVPAGEYIAVSEVYRPSAKTWHAEDRLTVLARQ